MHVQGFHTLVAPMAMFAALSAGLPYVVSLHTGGHSSPLRNAVRPFQARLLIPFIRRAGAVICGSRVRGTFDDCQGLVKRAFAEHESLMATGSRKEHEPNDAIPAPRA